MAKKTTKAPEKTTDTIQLDEITLLRFTRDVAMKAATEARVRELQAAHDLKLSQLDEKGELRSMRGEISKLMQQAQEQQQKLDESINAMGEAHGINVRDYNIDVDTGVLRPKLRQGSPVPSDKQ